jgi:sporulation related protein
MAAHIGQPTRSRRYIKLYLSTWALLASGALAYLAVLSFPPKAEAPPPAPQATVKPAKDAPTDLTEVKVRPVKTTEVKALAEVQGSLSEIRKDVSQLQEAVGERVVNEKVVETRLNALEERVSTIDPPQQPPAPSPAAAQNAKVPGISLLPASEPRAAAAPPFKPVEEPAASTMPPPPSPPIETGSIPKAEIVFGEPVVTRASGPEMAVQLAAGPSLQSVRHSWEMLSGRHAGTLGTLKPRVVAPRGDGGVYRLLAGPLPTKADAERICSQLGVGAKACFATRYAGAPL